MKGKSLSAGTRLMIGLCTLLSLIAVYIFFNEQTSSQLIENSDRISRGTALSADITRRNTDLAACTEQIEDLMSGAGDASLSIETDDHKCNFGKWLYGGGRREAELFLPGLAPIFKQMESQHAALHAAGASIANPLQDGPHQADRFLLQVKTAQQSWQSEIKDAFLEDGRTLDFLPTDPDQCELGQWMHSDETRTLILANREFADLFKKLELLHNKLHGSISDINKFLVSGDRFGAMGYYKRTAEPVFRLMASHIDSMIAWYGGDKAGQSSAEKAYKDDLLPAMKQVQSQLDHAQTEIQHQIKTARAALAETVTMRRYLLIAGAAVLLLVILLILNTGVSLFVSARKKEGGKLHAAPEPSANGEGYVASGRDIAVAQGRLRTIKETGARISDAVARDEEIMTRLRMTADNIAVTAGAIAAHEQSIAEEGIATPRPAAMGVPPGIPEQLKVLVETITELAAQANMLSLNASIEAARSGSHGKGMSLIADEVGVLAQRSEDITKDINRFMDEASAPEEEPADIPVHETPRAEDTGKPDKPAIASSAADIAAWADEVKILTQHLFDMAENNAAWSRELQDGLDSLDHDLASASEETLDVPQTDEISSRVMQDLIKSGVTKPPARIDPNDETTDAAETADPGREKMPAGHEDAVADVHREFVQHKDRSGEEKIDSEILVKKRLKKAMAKYGKR